MVAHLSVSAWDARAAKVVQLRHAMLSIALDPVSKRGAVIRIAC